MSEEPVAYMERTRLYYRALGYDKDYVWAGGFDEIPFSRLSQPLAQSHVALITTAGPSDFSNRDAAGRKQVWSGECATVADKFDVDLAWDREATHMDDRETFLPVNAAELLVQDGVFAGLTKHFHGVPTEYSHRKTIERDAPEILQRLRAEKADAAVLIAI